MQNETGIVWTDHGCASAARRPTVCPHDAPTYDDEAGCMLKCDMCKARAGRAGASPSASPAALCARSIWHARGHDREVRRGRRRVEPCRTTHPNLIRPASDAQSGSSTSALVNLKREISNASAGAAASSAVHCSEERKR
ncbi:MAG: hypothetical protein ACLT98_15945 [Eggerthellaceae bacterium]